MAITRTNKGQVEGQVEGQGQEARERVDLTSYSVEVRNSRGQGVGAGIELKAVSHLPEKDGHRETYGGMLAADFVDPVSGEVPTFTGTNGAAVKGRIPIRFFGQDAAVLAELTRGPRPGHRLTLVLESFELSAYRREDGSLSFLALSAGKVRGFRWTPEIVEID